MHMDDVTFVMILIVGPSIRIPKQTCKSSLYKHFSMQLLHNVRCIGRCKVWLDLSTHVLGRQISKHIASRCAIALNALIITDK